jgi:hypothetical protein
MVHPEFINGIDSRLDVVGSLVRKMTVDASVNPVINEIV